MGDIKNLIDTLLSDIKTKGQFDESKVYSDEPILFTASQMKNYTPPIYREMRKLATSGVGKYLTSSEIFFRQAKFMEKHEDDYEYRGEFSSYFPTYQSMNTFQLRGYFTWRAAVRRGEIKAVSFSFACVYMYELIMLIGAASPDDAFRKLKSFSDAYSNKDRRIIPYSTGWLRDFVVYYGLDSSLISDTSKFSSDEALLTVLDYENRSKNEVTIALSRLSNYSIVDSSFYNHYSDDTDAVVYYAFSSLCDFYKNNKSRNIFKTIFGSKLSYSRPMFASAMFYEEKPHEDCVYEVNALYKYICKYGKWTFEQSYRYINKNEKAGLLLKSIDCIMRQRYSFKYKLKSVRVPEEYAEIINNAIDALNEEKRIASIPKIEIDTSVLQTIRDNSIITQQKLIIEEEELTETVEIPIEKEIDTDLPLTKEDILFLRTVLRGGNYSEILNNKRLMASVVVDSINEKLFDLFGDNVLLLEGQEVVPIEDYTDELKGLIKS